ncbi:hypothetical protein [Methyloglobulus morosus]|uniref:hypothetical protein n=1 Tax=Methyloglobulus morosus TaxID=1410681 RepID=UPI0004128023|nr:hypothetical protein [Methyloglobulus morosus]
MKKEQFPARSAYKRYTAQFKEQALERAGRDGYPQGGAGFGLAEATLYAWQAKRRRNSRNCQSEVHHDQN